MKTEKLPVLVYWLLASCFPPSFLMAAEAPVLTIPELDPKFDGCEVTLTFTVERTEGVAQLLKPGEPATFVIETAPEHDVISLQVWVRGDLADVMERLKMGLSSPNLNPSSTAVGENGMKFVRTSSRRQVLPWMEASATV